jgi:hypothetical protein
MTDRDMIIRFVQGRGLNRLGMKPEQVRDRPISTAFPCGEKLAESCRRAMTGQEFIATVSLCDIPFEIYYSSLKDAT